MDFPRPYPHSSPRIAAYYARRAAARRHRRDYLVGLFIGLAVSAGAIALGLSVSSSPELEYRPLTLTSPR